MVTLASQKSYVRPFRSMVRWRIDPPPDTPLFLPFRVIEPLPPLFLDKCIDPSPRYAKNSRMAALGIRIRFPTLMLRNRPQRVSS